MPVLTQGSARRGWPRSTLRAFGSPPLRPAPTLWTPRTTSSPRAGTFGPAARLVDLVVAGYTDALRGDIPMNCSLCVHRVALRGFEAKVGAPATPHYHPDEPGHQHGRHH